jgi:hypothetical protein
VLHLIGAVFFLPEEINPLPLGMKTGYLVQSLITYHALSSVFTTIGSLEGFLTMVFTVFMEVLVWLSFLVFGVVAKSIRVLEGFGEWLKDEKTHTTLVTIGELLEGLDDAIETQSNQIPKERELNQPTDSVDDLRQSATDPIRSQEQSNLSKDDDISRFEKLSDGTRNKVNQMWKKAFKNK